MGDVLEIAVKQHKIIRVDNRDYSLAFPLRVVAALEETLGRSMKTAGDWLRIQVKEVQVVLEAGFTHYHPDEAKDVAAAIANTLEPEEIESVIEALCWASCPKAMERVQAALEKARERVLKGLPPLPNAQSADVA